MQDVRANQLKNLSRLSVVVAAFSMSSFLEFNFDATTVTSGVLVVYGITTAAVVRPPLSPQHCLYRIGFYGHSCFWRLKASQAMPCSSSHCNCDSLLLLPIPAELPAWFLLL